MESRLLELTTKQWEDYVNSIIENYNDVNNKVSGIYYIRNKVNGKVYIGQSNNIEKRLNEHIKSLQKNQHFNIYLQREFNKYGKDNFYFGTFINCDTDKNNFYEEKIIKECRDLLGKTNIYNIKNGGDNLEITPEIREKISKAIKGRKLSDEHKKSLSLHNSHYWQGKKRPQETNKKISIANKGKRVSIRTEFKKGHKVSAETLDKVKKGFKEYIAKDGNKEKLLSGLKKYYETHNVSNCKKVILDNKIIFNSISECARYLNIKVTTLSNRLNNNIKTKDHTINFYNGGC